MATYWTNDDGLTIHYGTMDSVNKGRRPEFDGPMQQLVLDIVGTELADTASTQHLVGAASIPAGAHLVSANLYVTTAFAGTSAVLDIGVYKSSDLSAVDDDGIDSAIAVGSLTDEATIASDGALIGTALAFDSVIAASYDTAAFTAGVAKLIVNYFVQ